MGGLGLCLVEGLGLCLCLAEGHGLCLAGAFALRKAMPFALLWAFALRMALPFALVWAFALRMALPFALVWAFALQMALPFALVWAFALLRAMAFALLRAMGPCLPSVWHVVRVGALWPGTKGKLLRLSGLQQLGWGLKDDLGRGDVAGERGQTPAAQRPATGGLGVERRTWSGRCGRRPRANCCGSAARSGWVRRGTTTLVGAPWPGTEG